jgi:hypothetical protein
MLNGQDFGALYSRMKTKGSSTSLVSCFGSVSQRYAGCALALNVVLTLCLVEADPWLDIKRHQTAAGNDEDSVLAMQLWYNACEKLGVERRDPGDEEISQVSTHMYATVLCVVFVLILFATKILDRTPRRFRDQVCERANSLVLCSYDFVDTYTLGNKLSNADMAKILVENRAKYAVLKDKFHYQVRFQALLPIFGYLRFELIQNVLWLSRIRIV